jgi:hypothetical protein
MCPVSFRVLLLRGVIPRIEAVAQTLLRMRTYADVR